MYMLHIIVELHINLSILPGEVADYLRNQEFYWSVIGVSTEQEMVDRLTSLSPPLPPIELTDEFGGINVTQHLGCFVGGAGDYTVFVARPSLISNISLPPHNQKMGMITRNGENLGT